MTFYLPNTDVRPTGSEPAEFIDLSADEVAWATETGPVTDDQAIADVTIRAAGETR